MANLTDEVIDIKNKQKSEVGERVALAAQVDTLKQQVQTMVARLEKVENAADTDEIVSKVTEKFSKEINTNHFNNLANEIKQTETSLIIFGYKVAGGYTNLEAEIKQIILIDTLQVDFDLLF